MALLTRTNKTTDKQVQQVPGDELERLTQQLNDCDAEVQRLTESIAPLDQLMTATQRRDLARSQYEIVRARRWQGYVNGFVAAIATAKTELDTLEQQREENDKPFEESIRALNDKYSWDGMGGDPPSEWVEQRIAYLVQRERCRIRHQQLSNRIDALRAIITHNEHEMDAWHVAGVRALDMTPYQLHPTLIGAGPDGMWMNGVFTPAPPPIPAPAAPARKPVWRVETMLPAE